MRHDNELAKQITVTSITPPCLKHGRHTISCVSLVYAVLKDFYCISLFVFSLLHPMGKASWFASKQALHSQTFTFVLEILFIPLLPYIILSFAPRPS